MPAVLFAHVCNFASESMIKVAPVPPRSTGSIPDPISDASKSMKAGAAAVADFGDANTLRLFAVPATVATPVPPFATGNVPVTPGRGDAANISAAVVDPRLVSIDGAAVNPVPPLATPNVPAFNFDVFKSGISAATNALNEGAVAVVPDSAVAKIRLAVVDVAMPVPPFATGKTRVPVRSFGLSSCQAVLLY